MTENNKSIHLLYVNYGLLFKTNKTSKESVLLIDRGTPTSIFSSSMIMQLVTKKKRRGPRRHKKNCV